MIPFKRGAFSGLTTVVPIVAEFKVEGNTVYPFTGAGDVLATIIMMLSTFETTKVSLKTLPPF
jgi:hypothetical protein